MDGEAILMAVDDVALSSGSACTSGTIEPSHVLKACGIPDELALASIRFGLGRFTTEEEVDYAADKVSSVITHLRATTRRSRYRRTPHSFRDAEFGIAYAHRHRSQS